MGIIDKLKDSTAIKTARTTDSSIGKDGFTKDYTSKTRTLLIEKDDKSTLINMKLLSSYRLMVGAGTNTKVAEIRLIDWTSKTDIFDALGFYDKKDGHKELTKTHILKYAEDKTIQIEAIDEDGKTHFIDHIVPDWENAVEFTKIADLPHKDIAVGIFTDTILGEKIEWLPTIDGFEVYEWAAYDVTQIDSLEHDTVQGTRNSLVMIDSTHFILAYASGADYDGFIKTFSIDGSYDNITEIDVLEHDTALGCTNSLVRIDSTHFILAYGGADDDGFIKTFSIDGSYDNITEIDSLEHYTGTITDDSLVMIDSTHFMLAYADAVYDGFIKTFSIDGSYDNITEIDVLEHDAASGTYNSLVMIDSTHFILAYEGADNDGFIKTFSIDGSYDNITEIDVLEHDTALGRTNSLVRIDSTHFILAYGGADNDGFIKTFSIDGSYDNITEIDSLEHDTANGLYVSLVMIDSTHFILAYRGADNDGFIKTFSIDGSYDNITQISSLEHDTVYGIYNSLVMIDSTHFILAYEGADSDGFIKTFSIEAPSSAINMEINIGDSWKNVDTVEINIGDSWKTVTKAQINVGDDWKTIFEP